MKILLLDVAVEVEVRLITKDDIVIECIDSSLIQDPADKVSAPCMIDRLQYLNQLNFAHMNIQIPDQYSLDTAAVDD